MANPHTIGLALGGGGARGIAHLVVLETLDELGLKPDVIAGTSIGAVLGAGYAAGLSGAEMREEACRFYAKRREVFAKLWSVRPQGFANIIRGRLSAAQFDPFLILDTFVPGLHLIPESFEELRTPLRIIACDYYGWKETVLAEGPLKPAIAASIAMPSIFRPVPLDGRLHIDGGAINPVPFDHVEEADIVIAVDVAGGPVGSPDRYPRLLETIVGAAQISMQAIMAEKMKRRAPDILVRPEVNGVFVLDFLKTEAILCANTHVKDELKRQLDDAFERRAREIDEGRQGRPRELVARLEPMALAG